MCEAEVKVPAPGRPTGSIANGYIGYMFANEARALLGSMYENGFEFGVLKVWQRVEGFYPYLVLGYKISKSPAEHRVSIIILSH